MKLGDHEFEYVCDIEPLRETDGSLRHHMSQGRYINARNLPLNRYGSGPFCKFRIPNRLEVSGVYVLTVDGAPRYVCECANLSARFNAGYGNISPKNCFKGGQEKKLRNVVEAKWSSFRAGARSGDQHRYAQGQSIRSNVGHGRL